MVVHLPSSPFRHGAPAAILDASSPPEPLSMLRALSLLSAGLMLAGHVHAAGALAIDERQGDQYGFSYDYPSMNDAANKALNECGRNCQVVQTFANGCAAYAADQRRNSTVYGWGTASNGGQAQATALQYCRSNGGVQCTVRAWGCHGR